MCDIEISPELLPLKDVAKLLPCREGGRRIHYSTVWRWALRGVRGVKLATIVIGDTRYTSKEALKQFAAALTDAADADRDQAAPEPTSRARSAAHRRAVRELEKAGL